MNAKGTPADPLREALPQILRDAYENALDGQSGWPWVEVAHAAINALATKPAEPDYWPSAKVTVHEDEVSYGVHRLTIELYAPGLPPGVYTMYLPGHPTESAAKPAEGDESSSDFDAWQANPYTKVLQKSIDEDYVPRGAPLYAADVAELQARIERLTIRGAAYENAYRIAYQATYQSHTGHWDKTGRSGAGCPECIRAREARENCDAALKEGLFALITRAETQRSSLTDEQFDEIACRYGTMGSEGSWIFREGALREFVGEVTSASQAEKK